MAVSMVSIVISLMLVSGGGPPDRPIQWMRLNLLILMVAMFLASASRGQAESVPADTPWPAGARGKRLSYNPALERRSGSIVFR